MSLTRDQQAVAATIYGLALKAGLTPARARELVAAAYAESTLNPRATNKSSGAAGLFQLLSSGYRTKAQQLGGLYDPVANTQAILPNYVSYWKSHPQAAPGEAARDVELSGEGAGFYSRPLSLLGDIGGTVPSASQPPSSMGMAGMSPGRAPIAPLSAGELARINAGFRMGANAVPPVSVGRLKMPTFEQPPPQPRTVKGMATRPVTPATPAGNNLASLASAQLGQPYIWGAESRREGGFDCSGLVDWALRQQGYSGPRVTTWTLAKMGQSVKGQQLRPGDLVLANNNQHVVIYAGNGRVIAAPHRGTVVQYQPLSKFNITDVRRL